MTRQEFNSYLDELTSETGFDLSKEQKAFAYQAAKEYHNQALRIHDVVGRSEQLKCVHQWRDSGGYFRCCKCGEYGNATT